MFATVGRMFAALLAHPGVVEHVELRSTFGFLAFHGGSLEKGTDDIARESARRAGASLYAVVQPPDLRWHIPSNLFDPADSPSLTAFLAHVDVAIAIHGFGREGLFTSILAGGANRELAAHVAGSLRDTLGCHGYEIIDDLERIPAALRGLHPDNPVNGPRSAGVQLELPPRVRGLGPFWTSQREHAASEDTHTARTPHTEALITGLVDAATRWSQRES